LTETAVSNNSVLFGQIAWLMSVFPTAAKGLHALRTTSLFLDKELPSEVQGFTNCLYHVRGDTHIMNNGIDIILKSGKLLGHNANLAFQDCVLLCSGFDIGLV